MYANLLCKSFLNARNPTPFYGYMIYYTYISILDPSELRNELASKYFQAEVLDALNVVGHQFHMLYRVKNMHQFILFICLKPI